ncbi:MULTISPECIES: ACT domain-containing protein [unclassified Colwellia]|uniref:ACT domain-containing protein n=1 Tax=unclassified Colwellia TaxID=196834 RepID=UPI0015F61DFC|nr:MULTISPECIES: ACT domain-containing protein [unclassified Colwellia]MBA6379925.1 ACT domain-containing protein [Colwellia sp. BRX10-7]MBA6386505.1 ACT domain-containing protein [Colwellia sp. BRX10-2]MBA6401615.1 ACT domain-containing protein [Colwellia sp. BRX10-5]MBA6406206.1 ACT domain-containing protein [Colwellia sp. BRX10-1]
MSTLTLKLLEETFAIHSLASDIEIPKAVFDAPIFFIAKTYEETSIVLPQSIHIVSDEIEKDWQALEVVGPLDFTLTGILSKISTILAKEKISIFAISTFDTDYILVKSNNVSLATTALISNDYQII